MAEDKLSRYRRMRDADRTPEPIPAAGTLTSGPFPAGEDNTFVIQEHHARSLHWDVRLERGGVLVSWAVPRGLPPDRKKNHLAVHTEDHPLEYARFEGEIPHGEYGGGQMMIWDRGTYETEKWSDREVKIVFHGSRASGRYVFFHTDGRNWMVRRMDPPTDPDWRPLPAGWEPMRPVDRARLPRDQSRYAFEFDWGGRRAAAFVSGGRMSLYDGENVDIGADRAAVRALAETVGGRQLLLDGELVLLGGTEVYVIYDLLHADGHDLYDEPYERRRARLEELDLAGPRWHTAPSFPAPGIAVRDAAGEQGLPGVLAKPLASEYTPAATPTPWLRIPITRT